MRVAVYGSWRQKSTFDIRGDPEEFRRVCAEIGRLIGQLGHTLVLYSVDAHLRGMDADTNWMVDFDVARAYLQHLRTQHEPRTRLILLAPSDKDPASRALLQEFSDLITILRNAELRARQGLGVVAEVDRLITLGGSTGTYGIGVAARTTRIPFVPIAVFGGTSQLLLSEEQEMAATPQDAEFLGQFGVAFGPKQLEQLRFWLDPARTPRVLLIHGHSDDYKKVRDFLVQELGCPDPIVMKDAFDPGLTLPEKWEKISSRADAAIALVTPDDEGRLAKGNPRVTMAPRARQNVWLEVGYFWGRLDRSRLFLLKKGNLEQPSDLLGLECYLYRKDPGERHDELRAFIESVRAGSVSRFAGRGASSRGVVVPPDPAPPRGPLGL